MQYRQMSRQQLEQLEQQLAKQYQEFKAQDLKLDMARGKPGHDQLDLSMQMMDMLDSSSDCKAADGLDCRNYGVLDGLPEVKQLFADLMDVKPENIIIGGNSSLNMMFDCISTAMTHGVLGSKKPWGKYDQIKFLCPVPGYDRHFAICEYFGIQMINVPMLPTGPDMDMVERLVASEETIKGIWCVPKYSNPQGITYSEQTVRRFGALKPAAEDFRIFWDNAYNVHHLGDQYDYIPNLLEICRENGNENMVFKFTSTSKITFPGAGIAAMAASVANVANVKQRMTIQTIGADKLNQLRHIKFLKDAKTVEQHMKKHGEILRPKFRMVLDTLATELGSLGIGEWNKPHGGYFVSIDTMEGCAKRVVELAKQAGVTMTPAGATYPYGKDPRDSNIRIAPTYPDLDELELAMQVFCTCVKLASVEKLLQDVQ